MSLSCKVFKLMLSGHSNRAAVVRTEHVGESVYGESPLQIGET